MLTPPCTTFQLLISSGLRMSSVCTQNAVSNRHLWINDPFTHLMFFWTNLKFWPPQYPVVVTPTVNRHVKGKTSVLLFFLSFFFVFFFFSLNHYLNISYSISSFLQCSKREIFLPYSLSLYHSFPSWGNFVSSDIPHMKAISSLWSSFLTFLFIFFWFYCSFFT